MDETVYAGKRDTGGASRIAETRNTRPLKHRLGDTQYIILSLVTHERIVETLMVRVVSPKLSPTRNLNVRKRACRNCTLKPGCETYENRLGEATPKKTSRSLTPFFDLSEITRDASRLRHGAEHLDDRVARAVALEEDCLQPAARTVE